MALWSVGGVSRWSAVGTGSSSGLSSLSVGRYGNPDYRRRPDRPGLDARVGVVSFLPELVCSLGSPSHDFAFLIPFYAQIEGRPNVLRRGGAGAGEAAAALAGLIREFFAPPATPYREAACKARLLTLLLVLAREFQESTLARPIPAAFLETVVAESLKAPARVWRELFTTVVATDFERGLDTLAAPTLILWGDHDAIFPGED